jgi:hypothetical protein
MDGYSRRFTSEHAATIFRQPDFCTCDLAFVGFAAQLPENFSDLGDASRTDWVTFGQQATTRVDWNTATQGSRTCVNQTSTSTLLAQPELFINNEFGWG